MPTVDRVCVLILSLVCLAMASCGASPAVSSGGVRPLMGNASPAEKSPEPGRSGVLALIGGRPVTAAQLRPSQTELAGAQALEELALDRALEEELRIRAVPDPLVATGWRQQEMANLGPGSSQDLDRFRAARRLGPARFEALLARTARLRALVAGGTAPTPQEIDLGARIRYGTRYAVRVLVLPTLTEASRARAEIMGAPDPSAAFVTRASTGSIDSSAASGGLLGDISADDPAYPASLRGALAGLRPATVSNAIALDDAFALVMVDRVIPEVPAQSRDLGSVERELTLRKERLAMDTLARELLARSRVTPLDDSLRWAWENRPGPAR